MVSRRIDGDSIGMLPCIPDIDNRILRTIDNGDTVAENICDEHFVGLGIDRHSLRMFAHRQGGNDIPILQIDNAEGLVTVIHHIKSARLLD